METFTEYVNSCNCLFLLDHCPKHKNLPKVKAQTPFIQLRSSREGLVYPIEAGSSTVQTRSPQSLFLNSVEDVKPRRKMGM